MIFKAPYPDVDIPRIPLSVLLLDRIRHYGDNEAIIDSVSGRTITYKQLAKSIRSAAGALAQRGFRKGDVFAVYSPNHVDYAAFFHSVSLIGGIVTTVNPLSSAEDLRRQLEDSGAKFLITVSAFLEKVNHAITPGIREIFTFDTCPGATPFSELLTYEYDVPETTIDATTDVVALPYSSGTTGFPKGVMLTHFNLVSNIMQAEGIQNFQLVAAGDRLIAFLPFFHIYGLVLFVNMALMKGATLVVMPKFDMIQMLEVIQKYRITRCCVVPPVVVGLAKHPAVSNYDTSSIVDLLSGAAPLSHDVAMEVANRLNCEVYQAYGMTETSPITHLYNRSLVRGKRLGSVGQPIPNTEVMVRDIATGIPVGVGERGEICVRGPQVMKGYLNNPAATASTIDKDGWIHTGDIGYVDEDGLFYVVDRVKELIKFKGFQVAPAELEAMLLTHPAVADVAVVPMPDEEAGEVPKAFIVKKPGVQISEQEIIAWVATQTSPQKRIRCVEFTDAIPKTASGKILRRLLVERDREKVAR